MLSSNVMAVLFLPSIINNWATGIRCGIVIRSPFFNLKSIFSMSSGDRISSRMLPHGWALTFHFMSSKTGTGPSTSISSADTPFTWLFLLQTWDSSQRSTGTLWATLRASAAVSCASYVVAELMQATISLSASSWASLVAELTPSDGVESAVSAMMGGGTNSSCC